MHVMSWDLVPPGVVPQAMGAVSQTLLSAGFPVEQTSSVCTSMVRVVNVLALSAIAQFVFRLDFANKSLAVAKVSANNGG